MKQIENKTITEAVARMCLKAAYDLPEDVEAALRRALEIEESPVGRDVLKRLIENLEIAREEKRPLCQDTGTAVFFIEKGRDVVVTGGSVRDAVNEGVRLAYSEGYLRKSMLDCPLRRVNTGDNTPAIVHFDETEGDELKISFMAKGGGCENMSALAMLMPSDGREGVIRFVVETVEKAWANPCPPIVVGVGIGGNFETAAVLAKKALLKKIGQKNEDTEVAALEEELLAKINNLGIGPQGFGGTVTALDVHVLTHAVHITGLPVAVNIECHAHRTAMVTL